ncbi:MAG: fibronectin type III domain-containing protein [Candidatus Nealsonbacteria bacterium]
MRYLVAFFLIIIIVFFIAWISGNLAIPDNFVSRIFLSQISPPSGQAVFYLQPASGTYNINDTFALELRTAIHSTSPITSIKAYLDFSPSTLSVTESTTTGSDFTTVWENSYNNSTGKIYLQVSVPSPGLTGDRKIAIIYFQAVSSGAGSVTYDSSSLALKLDDTNVLNLVNSVPAALTINTPPVSDTAPPYTNPAGYNPAKSATGVASSTNIVAQVQDDGLGVASSSIVMRVEGSVVIPAITGTPASYTLTYNPPANFSYDQVVDVTIDASDLASSPNAMARDSYFFTISSAPASGCTDCALEVPIINPASPGANQAFTISCPTNNSGYDCLQASFSVFPCNFVEWAGTEAVFICLGKPVATYSAKCQSLAGTGSNCCASERTASFNIVDSTPPSRSAGQPTGTLPAGTTQTAMSLNTNESATCKYSTSPGVLYSLMTNTFSTTGNTSHSTIVSGLSNGNTYNYYVKCQDVASSPNANITDYNISFSVAAAPDTTWPTISGHSPAEGASVIEPNTNISVSISDSESGVDVSTIVMTVEGAVVSPDLSGSPSSYTLIYDPSVNFNYDQVVDVTVDASDLASTPNVMPQDSYSFTIKSEPVEPPPIDGGDGGVLDITAPVISNVKVSDNSGSSATIIWNTNEPATSKVEYGPKTPYAYFTPIDSTLVSSHSVKLTNLAKEKTYYFRVVSKDEAGNQQASSGNSFSTFILIGDFNKDGKVNLFDLSIFLSNWNSVVAEYDLNGNQKVDVFDLSILLSNWTR